MKNPRHPVTQATAALAALAVLSACSTTDKNASAFVPGADDLATATDDIEAVAAQVEANLRTRDGYSTNRQKMRRTINTVNLSDGATITGYTVRPDAFTLCLTNDWYDIWATYDSATAETKSGPGERCP